MRAQRRGQRRPLHFILSTMLLCAGPLTLIFTGCDSDEECARAGVDCAKSCGEDEVPFCVSTGICACVPAMTGGDVGGGTPLGGVNGGGTGGSSSTTCPPPPMGALIINELLVDAVNEDTGEFFELANLHDEAVSLAGVKIVYRGSDKVRFLTGCMAPKSVGALWGDESAWAWSTAPTGLTYEKLSYRLSNSGDILAELVNESGEVLSELSATADLIEEGVSVNRAVDFTEGPSAQHTALFNTPHSAGLCGGGGALEEGCPASPTGGTMGPIGGETGGTPVGGTQIITSCDPPPSGALIINEVLVDAVDEATGEFFELANLHSDYVDLSGLKIVYRGSDKVRFLTGCMAPNSVGALWGDEEAWAWSSEPVNLSYEKLSYRLSNSGDVLAQLVNAGGDLLSELSATTELIEEGVSINRAVDFTEGPAALHTSLFGSEHSAGLCGAGGRLEEGCPAQPTGGSPVGGSPTGGEGGAPAGGAQGGGLGGEPAPQCDTPALGELVLNEVMIDAVVEPAEEYIELVNTTERPLSLAGLSVAYNASVKLSFERGCMPGRSAVAFYSDETLTSWSSAPEGLVMSQSSFRFANSNDFSFVLSNSSGEDLDRFEGLGSDIEPEVSLNRAPDLSGAPALHTSLSELSSSPGLCPHGGSYEEGCPNAPQGGAPAGGVEGGIPAGGVEGGAPAGGVEGGAPAGGVEGGAPAGGIPAGGVEGGAPAGGVEGGAPAGGAPAGGIEGGAPAGGAPAGGVPAGGVEGGAPAGGVEAGATVGGVEGGVTLEPCSSPSAGELVLNEVLANPLDNENLTVNKTEWVELINVTDQWLDLEGITLSNEDVIKVTFGALCLAPRSALVIYNQRDASSWLPSSPLQGDPLSSQVTGFSITNSRALNLTLGNQAGLLSELSTADAISSYPEGVSLNRDPDQDPNAPVSAHDSLTDAGGALSSQGLCANGARFEDGCTTP